MSTIPGPHDSLSSVGKVDFGATPQNNGIRICILTPLDDLNEYWILSYAHCLEIHLFPQEEDAQCNVDVRWPSCCLLSLQRLSRICLPWQTPDPKIRYISNRQWQWFSECGPRADTPLHPREDVGKVSWGDLPRPAQGRAQRGPAADLMRSSWERLAHGTTAIL